MCIGRFGIDNVKDIPHPGVDWRAFVAKIRELNNKEPKVFCPITETLKPWVDVGSLSKFYVTESKAASSSCIIT